jgi:hypothetical protein
MVLCAACHYNTSSTLNTKHADSVVQQLQIGDVILRGSNDAISNSLKLCNKHNKLYSHTGIVISKNNVLYIADVSMPIKVGDNAMQLHSITNFLSINNAKQYCIVRYPITKNEVNALNKAILNSTPIQFDNNFTIDTLPQVYCTEWLYNLLQHYTSIKIVPDSIAAKAVILPEQFLTLPHTQVIDTWANY